MNFKTRIITTLLAVIMILGSLPVIGTVSASAEKPDLKTEEDIAKYYLKTNKFKTPEEKLATMSVMLKNEKYELYVDSISGEVALFEPATGNYLFSNPYDVASSKGSDMFKTGGTTGTKEQLLMSQVIIQFMDNGTSKTLYSFQDAAMRGQIDVSRIKGGVRVEYTIGREEFRKLVPRWIPADVFDELIKKPMLQAVEKGAMGGVSEGKKPEDNFYFKQFMTYYQLKDPSIEKTQGAIDAMYKAYPITKEMPIYVFATDASAVEINKVEGYIKDYCSDTYSFEQMDIDHETTGYEATDEEYPVFKLALEYTLDENGLSVRMPCNGLQYNMSSYTLENISILPYMGAGNTKNEGYNFYPDGSGSLFDFNLKKTNTIRSKIYGTDYAYHQITGTYQKAIRVPVYGTVATEVMYSYGYTKTTEDDEGNIKIESFPDVEVSSTVMSREEIEKMLASDGVEITKPLTERSYKRGYVAIIESGESLGEIETYFAGALSDYATMSNYFNPKPKDSYDISDSISVTSSSTWTVVSNRKYTGSIKIHYQMLCDEQIGKAQQAKDSNYTYYDASWLGMAEAYRAYLIKNNVLTKLSDTDVQKDIPLYMEVFGALKTQQTIATIPVNVMTPLTTFEDILTMYSELSKEGINNINFKMTGFANGGMYSKIPSSLKWEGKVGGKSGFKKLVEQAKAINAAGDGKHIGLFPDFDFAYCGEDRLFDSLHLKEDAIKTIDNRYTSLRQYSATQQKYVTFYQLAISPSRYSKFYEKLMKNYSKFGLDTLSVGSLGNALNSDFDEDAPFNREDSKRFTVKAFQDMKEANYSLMTDGGNAYSWEFVDYIVNMDLDSSRYVKASCSVPFMGAVLHGYIQFAGTPLNEEGDADYAILKAIENGAGMYFLLSYQNTQELKEDEVLSQYYSIRYDIWRKDVVKYYTLLNSLLGDVQTKQIIGHTFLNHNGVDANGNKFLTERILDDDELQKEIEEELKKAEEDAREEEKNEAINKVASVAEARIAIQQSMATLKDVLSQVPECNQVLEDTFKAFTDKITDMETNGCSQSTVNISGVKATAAWNAYQKLDYQFILADKAVAELEAQLQLIKDAKVGTSAEYQYNDAVTQLNAAKTYLAEQKELQKMKYELLTGDDTKTFEGAFEALVNKVIELATKHNTDNAGNAEVEQIEININMEDIKKNGAYVPEVEKETETEESGKTENTRYHVSNNSVVAVTYGTVEAGVKVAYKTFILNYNNFDVRVTYNGIVYTVPAGGYVIPAINN